MSGLNVDIRIENLDRVRDLMEQVGKRSTPIMSSVVRATAKEMKQRGQLEIRKQLNLKAAYVKARLPIVRVGPTTYRIKIEARGRLMSQYPSLKQKPKGVSVRIKPKGKASFVPGAFIIPKLRNVDLRGVAYLRPKDKPGPKGGRFKVLHSGSLTQAWDDVMPALSPEFSDFMLNEYERRLNVELAKHR